MGQGGNSRRADGSGIEREALDDLLADVRRARKRLDPASVWQPTLEELESELQDGEPFVFKVAFASSSKSKSDTPVVSS
jgi:hypothetical protein